MASQQNQRTELELWIAQLASEVKMAIPKEAVELANSPEMGLNTVSKFANGFVDDDDDYETGFIKEIQAKLAAKVPSEWNRGVGAALRTLREKAKEAAKANQKPEVLRLATSGEDADPVEPLSEATRQASLTPLSAQHRLKIRMTHIPGDRTLGKIKKGLETGTLWVPHFSGTGARELKSQHEKQLAPWNPQNPLHYPQFLELVERQMNGYLLCGFQMDWEARQDIRTADANGVASLSSTFRANYPSSEHLTEPVIAWQDIHDYMTHLRYSMVESEFPLAACLDIHRKNGDDGVKWTSQDGASLGMAIRRSIETDVHGSMMRSAKTLQGSTKARRERSRSPRGSSPRASEASWDDWHGKGQDWYGGAQDHGRRKREWSDHWGGQGGGKGGGKSEGKGKGKGKGKEGKGPKRAKSSEGTEFCKRWNEGGTGKHGCTLHEKGQSCKFWHKCSVQLPNGSACLGDHPAAQCPHA